MARDHLQGDILSPLLWSLVVDQLIGGLIENGCCTLGCADGIAFLICGKFSEHCLGASPAVHQSAKDGNSMIYPEVRFKGLGGEKNTHTHACARARTHTHTHTHARAPRTHARTHARTIP